MFERKAVCGGIPVIRSMQSDFVGDDIDMLSGIINGCTNFMLTKMDQGGLSYEDSLAEASRLGYAEADPTLDVGGFDARSKLRILMRLAFGVEVDEDELPNSIGNKCQILNKSLSSFFSPIFHAKVPTTRRSPRTISVIFPRSQSRS